MQAIDLRPMFQGVRDQGRRGTCIAFAVTAGHEYIRYVITGLMEDLSEEALYYQCKVIDGDHDSGTTFPSVSQALKTMGQPTEDKWPYNKLLDDSLPSYMPPPDAVDPQFCYRATINIIQPDL